MSDQKSQVSYRVKEIYSKTDDQYWKDLLKNNARDKWLEGHGMAMLAYTFVNDKGETIPLFDKVEIKQGIDKQGNISVVRTYETTKERLDFYNNNYRKEVFASSDGAFPGMNNKEDEKHGSCPVKFEFGNSADNKAAFDNLTEEFTENKMIYSKVANEKIIYGVRIDLKHELNPPYSEWLNSHINGAENATGMMQLKYGNSNKPLFTGVKAEGKKFMDGARSFLIQYNTTEAEFAHYVVNHASNMRSIIEKTYTGIFTPGADLHGVMEADRETIPLDGATPAQRQKYGRLKELKVGAQYRSGCNINFDSLINQDFANLIAV